ncbi:MAG TPA: anthranilate phosphoribosyltransferase [Candidatus Stackebrandtia faecavium]|nr:anthranilate phosphoribosyltransferase [Candidatus Stackebrandtia faecavium]
MVDRAWPQVLRTLLNRQELSADEARWAMNEIMSGEATPAQVAAFAVLLRAKGESAPEVDGLVSAMLTHTEKVPVEADCADIVGTGGDNAHTVNISTMASLVVAGGGVPVVKHGNRAASSKCGSADLLEELGIPLDLSSEAVVRCVTEAGIGFCFAARFHPGMRHAAKPRREMGIPTAFNFLGPLSNPAQPRATAVGCADATIAPVMAEVLAKRGASALVVRGEDGIDELSIAAPTRIWLVASGTVTETVIDAAELGIARAPLESLRGGDAKYNARVAREVLAGAHGPARDSVVLNAAAAFAAHEGLRQDISGGVTQALTRGIARANETLDSGAAAQALDAWRTVANR